MSSVIQVNERNVTFHQFNLIPNDLQLKMLSYLPQDSRDAFTDASQCNKELRDANQKLDHRRGVVLGVLEILGKYRQPIEGAREADRQRLGLSEARLWELLSTPPSDYRYEEYDSFGRNWRSGFPPDFYKALVDLVISEFELPEEAYDELLVNFATNPYVPDSLIVDFCQKIARKKKAERDQQPIFAPILAALPSEEVTQDRIALERYFQEKGLSDERSSNFAARFKLGFSFDDRNKVKYGIENLMNDEIDRSYEAYLLPVINRLLRLGKHSAAIELAKGYFTPTRQIHDFIQGLDHTPGCLDALVAKLPKSADSDQFVFNYVRPLLARPDQHERVCKILKDYPGSKTLVIHEFLRQKGFNPPEATGVIAKAMADHNQFDDLDKYVDFLLLAYINTVPIVDAILSSDHARAKDILVKIARVESVFFGESNPRKTRIENALIERNDYTHLIQLYKPGANDIDNVKRNKKRLEMVAKCMLENNLDMALQFLLEEELLRGLYSEGRDYENKRDALIPQLVARLYEAGKVQKAQQAARYCQKADWWTQHIGIHYLDVLLTHYLQQNNTEAALGIARAADAGFAGIADYYLTKKELDMAMAILSEAPDHNENKTKLVAASICSQLFSTGRIDDGVEFMKGYNWKAIDLFFFTFRLQEGKKIDPKADEVIKRILSTILSLKVTTWESFYERGLINLCRQYGIPV